MHRDPRYFSPYPDTFWPERWLLSMPLGSAQTSFRAQIPPGETLIHNMDAYIPFSYGPANCAGKALAWQEMYAVAALLVHGFDMQLAAPADRWEDTLLDHFVMTKGPLLASISPRPTTSSNGLDSIFSPT